MRLWLALSTVGLAMAALPVASQDGPIRQRLKERMEERQHHKAATQAQAGAAAPITAGDHEFTLQHGGLARAYRVHVPATYDPAVPAPMLFALHGGGGNMGYQANNAHYGLITLSERQGVVVVFPNGFSTFRGGRFATWNAGTCCGKARDREVDDVGFIRQVVTDVTRRLNIDRARVFAAGMSNGGMMSYRLACEMPDVFKAIAAVAGTDNTTHCSPQNPVSVLHIRAKDDSHVLYGGGAGPGARNQSAVTEFVSVPDTVAKWVGLNGCSATPRRVLDQPGAYCELYSPCRDQAEVKLCVTATGGHSWPGGRKPRGDEPPSQAISANEVMWEFFTRR